MAMFPGWGVSAGLIRTTRPLLGWLVALSLFGAILLADVIAPPEVDVSAFYLVPVIWLTWCRGTREGLCMALFCGVGWYLHDFLSGRAVSSEWFRLLDAVNKQVSYLLAAWVMGALRWEALAQQDLNKQLTAAMAEVRELEGLLPVCAWCHNIRDEGGQWHPMELFLAQRTKAATTHGICPICEARFHEEAGPGEEVG
jgi:hypothetical protein